MDDVERAYRHVYVLREKKQITRVTFIIFEQDDYIHDRIVEMNSRR